MNTSAKLDRMESFLDPKNKKRFEGFSIGDRVTNGRQLGIITDLDQSNGGMFQAWVQWDNSTVPIPEQPVDLKPEPSLTNLVIKDFIIINQNHELAGERFQIKEFRGDGWILTESDQFFHCHFFLDESFGGDPPEIIELGLNQIRRDGGTQPRSKINFSHVKLLEQQIEEGQEIDPVVVFYDGEFYWLADGFHRWNAHKNQKQSAIKAIIHQGQRRDAVLYSVGANSDHKPALPRSCDDKRRAVTTLLNDPEWKQWSDREIARRSKTSQPFVSKLRKSLTDNVISEDRSQEDINYNAGSGGTESNKGQELVSCSKKRTYITKHSTVSTMNTGNIGKRRSPKRVINPWHTGQVAIINPKGYPELKRYEGLWCIVSEVREYSCTVKLYSGEVDLYPENLEEVICSNRDQEQYKDLCDRLFSIYSPDMEEIGLVLLKAIARNQRCWLTDLEKTMLQLLQNHESL